MDSASYQGHSIFRNQPSFKHFDKSFEDPSDALFLGLNEVHPLFLSEERQKEDAALFQAPELRDPRNKQPVLEVCIDHTKPRAPRIFRSHRKSTLTKAQHVVCLRVVQALANRSEVDESDLNIFRRTERKRQKERLEFFKFVNEYNQSQRERIYAPAKQLVELYGQWFRRRAAHLMELKENTSYNTHTGLPHTRLCGNGEQSVEIVDVRVVERRGLVNVWREDVDCTGMRERLKTYAGMYVEAMGEREQLQKEADVQEHTTDEGENSFEYHIPLESLLFLLIAGDYPDLPTELLLQIANDDEKGSVIKFESPLPARHCGWHTHKKVVEQALQAYQSVQKDALWVDSKTKELKQQRLDDDEIIATVSEGCEFNPKPFEDFLSNLPTSLKPSDNKIKFNEALVKWALKDTQTEETLQLFTTLPQSPATDENATDFLGGFSIKLEFKPQFGCEYLTKYELLKEWLTLHLLAPHEASILHRLRISVVNFETLLQEKLIRAQIEQNLIEVYSVRVSRLLSGLFEFLKMLQKMPPGSYMLRFNPKFRDKLMLCAPSQEITQNTIFLHALLKEEPSDLLFMTQYNFLPVSDLCSSVHFYHHVLPCAFLPTLTTHKSQGKPSPKKAKKKVATTKFNDREFIQKRVKKKVEAAKAKESLNRKQHKRRQNLRRRERLKAKKAELEKQQNEEKELQREMDLDKMLFGCD